MLPQNKPMKEIFDSVIESIEVGKEFLCNDIIVKLSHSPKGRKKRGVSARQIASLLSRRCDLELIDRSKGIWKKVKEENT